MSEASAEVDSGERLIDAYNRYFEVMLVDDRPDLINEVYRLRYHIYCIEHPFEDPAQFPDQLERDRYDDRSLHSLLIHRPSGVIAGTVRLILPEPGRPCRESADRWRVQGAGSEGPEQGAPVTHGGGVTFRGVQIVPATCGGGRFTHGRHR